MAAEAGPRRAAWRARGGFFFTGARNFTWTGGGFSFLGRGRLATATRASTSTTPIAADAPDERAKRFRA
jgi:hypothetical protein